VPWSSRVKTLDRFHESDVAFLNQVSQWQTIARKVPGNMYNMPKVTENQVAGGVQVFVVLIALGERFLVLRTQHGQIVDRSDIAGKVT